MGGHRAEQGPQRRTVLLLGAGAMVAGVAGQWIGRVRSRVTAVDIPAATDAAGAFPQGLEATYDGISPLRTPTADFYRVDTRLVVPTVGVDDWTLTINGDVENELTLTFDELAAMPLIERDITLNCVSNAVGGPYVGSARWLGVRLTDLLDRAGVGDTADQILSTDVDGFTISTPLAAATDGRDAMVVIGMNGGPLPRERGFPCRLLTPGLYGYVGATKWLTRLTLTTYDQRTAYWTERDWAVDAPVKVASRIDTPKALATVDPGRVVIGGVAWAQTRGIAKVEVRIDDGEWREAELGPDVTVDYWRQWYLEWDATTGRHDLAVRATTEDGELQTEDRASPFPDGASGWQSIAVLVS